MSLALNKIKKMRVVLQRVTEASVQVNGALITKIGTGLLVLVGIEVSDTEENAAWIASKIVALRIFDDSQKIPNLSLLQTGGDLLLVSQFTLHALTKKGNRPSYIRAARPEQAIPLYEKLSHLLENELGKPIYRGIFGADMKVSLVNDGPLTILIDSKHRE
jgi:D-tyrosyl-tRNA(Tyr) deacylase